MRDRRLKPRKTPWTDPLDSSILTEGESGRPRWQSESGLSPGSAKEPSDSPGQRRGLAGGRRTPILGPLGGQPTARVCYLRFLERLRREIVWAFHIMACRVSPLIVCVEPTSALDAVFDGEAYRPSESLQTRPPAPLIFMSVKWNVRPVASPSR